MTSKCSLLACGSFNPITNMHLRMFDIAKYYLQTKKGITVEKGIISATNDNYSIHKPSLSPATHRNAMIRLALTDPNYKWIVCDDWETSQNGWVRTLNVLQHHRSVYGQNLKLLCGADLLDSFLVPGLWSDDHIEQIIKTFGIVVIPRSGSNPWKLLLESEKANIFKRYIDLIIIVDGVDCIDISSTIVRNAVKEGQPIDQLVPRDVATYIRNKGLYKY